MPSNKKKVLVPHSMGKAGLDLFTARDDVEVVKFPNMIPSADFRTLLKDSGEVNGVALGGTPYGRPELAVSKGMQVVARIGVGFDAVDVPALTEKRIPLMTAGIANSPSVA